MSSVVSLISVIGVSFFFAGGGPDPRQASSQRPITLVGTILPEREQITSESRCGSTAFSMSWINYRAERSNSFRFSANGENVSNQGTERVQTFLSSARNVRLAGIICGGRDNTIEIALTGLLMRPDGGRNDEVRQFFRLGQG